MIWSLIGPLAAALLLFAIGVIVLIVEVRALQWKIRSIEPPAINPYRFRRALEQLQRDLDAARLLIERANVAMVQINEGFAELSRSPIARLFRIRGS